ncbi:hypothetical protein L9F63_003977, partial [Diploptera punctata]
LVEGVACIGFVFVYQAVVVVSCFHDFHLFESSVTKLNFKILFFVWFDMVLLHSTPFNIFMALRT